ncbi:HET-domain-containing protein [Stipitochalara longipes BDJ]|nr:HET-domain-containing protein [Stipitochalara longipes BDJ]
MPTPVDTLCQNYLDLDIHGIFQGNHEMENGSISRKSQALTRWIWEKNEGCNLRNFWEKCSNILGAGYYCESEKGFVLRYLQRERRQWFEFGPEDVILGLIFASPPLDMVSNSDDESNDPNTTPHMYFLWVDMYCVNQDDLVDVEKQIRHMDLVYKYAQATIIAASGSDPNFGLPGLSSFRAPHQVTIDMEGISLASFPTNLWNSVNDSTWDSRAWTFQEGLFSPRRIFFTKEQMIFCCSQMYKFESIQRAQSCIRFNGKNQPLTFIGWNTPPCWNPLKEDRGIYDLIQRYSCCQLTFPGDILNAFSGVLHASGKLPSPVRHHWGIPILSALPLESFLFGLSWELSLSDSTHPISRRQEFPSWSSAGWEHQVSFSHWWDWYYREKALKYQLHPDFRVGIEFNDGSMIYWPEFEESIKQLHQPSNAAKFLIFDV